MTRASLCAGMTTATSATVSSPSRRTHGGDPRVPDSASLTSPTAPQTAKFTPSSRIASAHHGIMATTSPRDGARGAETGSACRSAAQVPVSS